MKRTSNKIQRGQELKRRLELVRTTIRELTPAELAQVGGGDTEKINKITCIPGDTYNAY